MKVIKVDLAKDLEKIELIPLADIHYGDKGCNLELLKEKLEYIKNTKNVYCVLNGDIIDNALRQGVGDVYNQEENPMKQIETIVELLKPIKDKIIAVTLGNHEYRTWKFDGIDLTKMICITLGIEDRYAKESALIFLRFGNQGSHNKNLPQCYTIFMNHGSGGGRKEGAKAIRLADMATIVDADIYIHSHTHLPMIMKQCYHRVSRASSSVNLVTKLFVNTSSMINYGGYGEMYEFKPNSQDTPHIFLDGKDFKFNAKL